MYTCFDLPNVEAIVLDYQYGAVMFERTRALVKRLVSSSSSWGQYSWQSIDTQEAAAYLKPSYAVSVRLRNVFDRARSGGR